MKNNGSNGNGNRRGDDKNGGRRVTDQPVRPFVLADRKTSFDTIKELRSLLERAERGEVIGFAYAILKPRQRYEIGYTGQFLEYRDAAIAPISRLLQDIMSE